jgi:hypothetical protein
MPENSTTPRALDVVLLLDDARELAENDASESYLFVSEAVEAIESALPPAWPHCSRSPRTGLGALAVIPP